MGNWVDVGNSQIFRRLGYWILLLVIASLGFIQNGLEIGDNEFLATDLLAILLVIVWLVGTLTRQIRFRWDRSYWFIIAYLAAAVVSTVFSSEPNRSFGVLPRAFYLAGLAFLTTVFVDRRDSVKAASLSWLIGSSFSILVGIFTLILFYVRPETALLADLTYHYGSVPVGNYPRLTATFPSASMFCNYLTVGLVIAMLAVSHRWLRPLLGYLLVIAALICALFTYSIGLGSVAMSLGLSPFIIHRANNKAAKALALTGITAAFGFLILSFVSLSPSATREATFYQPSSRVLVWRDAVHTFTANPIVGNGLGLPVANTIVADTDGTLSLLTDAHNSFLNVASQSGVAGLATLIALTMYLTVKWSGAIKSKADRQFTRAFGLAFFAAFVVQGLTGSFEEARHLWVLIGLLIAADGVEAKDAV